ncbi:8968_t:CDS:2, partial [Racocetra persica]
EKLQHETKQMQALDELWSIEERYNKLKNQLRNLQNIKNKLAKSQPYEDGQKIILSKALYLVTTKKNTQK